MHKYRPRIHIIEHSPVERLSQTLVSLPADGVCTFSFSETQFTTVTAYQNQQVTSQHFSWFIWGSQEMVFTFCIYFGKFDIEWGPKVWNLSLLVFLFKTWNKQMFQNFFKCIACHWNNTLCRMLLTLHTMFTAVKCKSTLECWRVQIIIGSLHNKMMHSLLKKKKTECNFVFAIIHMAV